VFIIVLGIFTFIANLIYSSRKGKPTGSNPWGADTLEWAVSSPPPNYGFSVTPIIRSRHPLWEQNDLHSGDPKLVHFVHTLASWPLKWRAALTCGTMDGQPEEVFRVSGPSIWPFVAAVGTVIIFFSEIFDLHLLTGFGALVIVASLIAWHWPDKAPMTEEEELAFERDTGVEVRAGGSRAVARWGMSLVILIIGIALTALLLTYFYLRLENTAWPPANIAPPQWPYALASAALLLGSAIPIYVALRGILAGNQQRLKLGLILAWLGAVAAVALQVFALRQEGFTWQAHAYASVFMVLSGFVLLITLVGLIMLGVVIFWAFRGSYSARRHVAIDNVLRFWVALVAVWWIGLGVLYATPYLT
jgi:cytochrome c oxidase subunit I+III